MFIRVLAALALVAAALFSTSPAVASPVVTINAGDNYGYLGYEGTCVIAAIGTYHGEPAALTAGHCGHPGIVVTTAAGERFGTFLTGTDGPPDDWGIIALDDGVAGSNRGVTEIAAPTRWGRVCKFGNGIERCGLTTKTDAVSGCTTTMWTFGDSGGPVYWGGKLYGVMSTMLDLACGGLWRFTRADLAVGFTLSEQES